MKTGIIFLFAFFFLHFSFVRAQDTVYVPQDYTTIQQGIDAASDSDIVLVDAGTYYENINFMGKAITVTSRFILDSDTNYINNTIIDGSRADNPDTSSTVLFISGEDTTSVLCGFTITGGGGLVIPAPGPRLGGGICCLYSSAKIVHNKIIGNEVTYTSLATGGGIFCGNDGGDFWIIIENNLIADNIVTTDDMNAWGGGISLESHARIANNTIIHNQCNSGMSNAVGGGVCCYSYPGYMSSVEVSDNIIVENEANGSGGFGGGIYNNGSAILITTNLIDSNITSGNTCSGAGICFEPGTPDSEITGNTIIRNYNDATSLWLGGGIAIPNPGGSSLITGNEISNNSGSSANSGGGGVFFQEAYDYAIILDGNHVVDNYSSKGGGVYARNSFNILMTNNLISGNSSAQTGAAINLFETGNFKNSMEREIPRPVIINNTFFGDTTTGQGGAVWCNYTEAFPITFNNIFWENDANSGKDIYYTGPENMIISNSDINPANISGLWEGEGNINQDPGFIDDTCHIDEASPCLNAGTDSLEFGGTWYCCPVNDFNGDNRPFPSIYCDPIPDIGAYEVEFDCVRIPELNTQHLTLKTRIYPNPTQGNFDLQFTVYDLRSVLVKIYDMHGREVANVLDKNLPAGEHVVRYDASGLPDGIYLVRVMAGETTGTQKIIKMRAY